MMPTAHKGRKESIMPWKKVRSSERSALTDQAIQRLAVSHGFSFDDVFVLSTQLVFPLSERFMPLGIFEGLHQNKRGDRARSEIIKDLKRVVRDLGRVTTRASHLSIIGKQRGNHTTEELNFLRGDLPEVTARLQQSLDTLLRSEKDGERIYDLSARNLRRDRDEVRPAVLKQVFLFWERNGRKTTITTSSAGANNRGGKLIDFVNDVVRELTSPPTEINRETIRSDLKRMKSEAKLFGRTISQHEDAQVSFAKTFLE